MEPVALMLSQYVDEYFIFSSVSSIRDSYVDEEIFTCLKFKLDSKLQYLYYKYFTYTPR